MFECDLKVWIDIITFKIWGMKQSFELSSDELLKHDILVSVYTCILFQEGLLNLKQN